MSTEHLRRVALREARAEVEVVDRRDPTAATRSLRYTTSGRAQPPDWNASRAFEIGVYSNVVVYACFQAIANTISALPFRAGPDPDKPTNYNVDAPLARLLGPPPGGPNPGISAEELWHFAIIQFLATGRFGWEIEEASGTERRPVALWPLVSANLNPIPSESGNGWYQGFQYGRPADWKNLRPDQVLYAWQPRGSDFRQPESALEAAHLDISIAVMQSKYDFAFLKNGAVPTAVVITEAFDTEDDYRAFQRQFESTHQGPNNAGKVVFAEATGDQGVTGSVDIKVLGLSQKDSQAAQQYAMRLQQIAIGLGVPWSRLDAANRTFANASEEDKIWWRQRLLPLIRRLQSAINIQLAPRLGTDVGWFDLTKVEALHLKPTPITQPATAPVLVQAQLMTVNEARADYGLDALPDGDRMMTAAEIAALNPTPTPFTPTGLSATAEGRKLHAFADAGDGVCYCGKPAVHQAHGYFMPTNLSATPDVRGAPSLPADPAATALAVEPPAPLPTAEEIEQRRTKIWNAAASIVSALERSFEQDMAALFRRQARSVLGRLEHKRARRQSEVRALVDEVFDPEHWIEETISETRRLYRNIAATAGGVMASRFGVAFDLEAPFVQDFINARANQLAGNVTQTTYDQIKATLAEGVSEGESIPDLSARIQHVFDVAEKSRATTIARTETISAYNGAGTETAQSYGEDVVAGQEWIATRDARTRDAHAERDGEIVNIGEPFSGGLMYPGDPSGDPSDTINCRCTVAYLTPEDMQRSAPRDVPVAVGRAVLSLVRVGSFDERGVRAALRMAVA